MAHWKKAGDSQLAAEAVVATTIRWNRKVL
jgi:hypothetical protein